MNPRASLRLGDIEQKVCDVVAEQLGIERSKITPDSRVFQDLNVDSLELVELIIEVEEAFDVTLPDDGPNPICKAVFTRQPFRLADIAELVYLQQGSGTPARGWWRRPQEYDPPASSCLPFSQLDGRWQERQGKGERSFERLKASGPGPEYRRRSDGMRCVLIPSAVVEIGSDTVESPIDERPWHVVELDSFLIDAEPVSTTAYCRFLNSIGEAGPDALGDWFVLGPGDRRDRHQLIARGDSGWHPLAGAERWPMILVSWHGANAYSLWANGRDWRGYRGESGSEPESFLPTEAQWEYAARGAVSLAFPWGNEPPSTHEIRFGRHRKGATYRADDLPMADVNARLGMSPFGLHHMAGNVWQWCRDWYNPTFYGSPDATRPNPVNRAPGKARSERGGSWIGPASLCRSSSRRGRPPTARGRCLGFRCISTPP